MLKWGLIICQLFTSYHVYQKHKKRETAGMQVYNVPQHSAADLFANGKYHFVGDSALLQNDFLRNFHLQPARTGLNLEPTNQLANYWHQPPFTLFNSKRILFPQAGMNFQPVSKPVDVDIVVLSGKVKTSITLIQQSFRAKQYVFDGRCPRWKMQQWKNECDSLHLRRHSVQEDGAFELDL